MACKYCHRTIGHSNLCPDANEQKSIYFCSYCEESITDGEEYVENDGEYMHYYCPTTREMIQFLGYEVKEMKREDH